MTTFTGNMIQGPGTVPAADLMLLPMFGPVDRPHPPASRAFALQPEQLIPPYAGKGLPMGNFRLFLPAATVSGPLHADSRIGSTDGGGSTGGAGGPGGIGGGGGDGGGPGDVRGYRSMLPELRISLLEENRTPVQDLLNPGEVDFILTKAFEIGQMTDSVAILQELSHADLPSPPRRPQPDEVLLDDVVVDRRELNFLVMDDGNGDLDNPADFLDFQATYYRLRNASAAADRDGEVEYEGGMVDAAKLLAHLRSSSHTQTHLVMAKFLFEEALLQGLQTLVEGTRDEKGWRALVNEMEGRIEFVNEFLDFQSI